MESLEELKAIIAGKPDGATDFSNRFNKLIFYKHSFLLGWFYWDGSCYRPLNTCPSNKTRSLSDIKRIIELMESNSKLQNKSGESFKEELLKATSSMMRPHIEGVYAVWEDQL